MKKKILTYALSALACLTSCSDWLDINHDPNTAEKVDPGYLFNYVAVNLYSFIYEFAVSS